jgi:[acyl-carrier-protein] S-malonyltransferase
MGKELFDSSQAARAVFTEANDALGFDLAELCFSGDAAELTKTFNAQPAILTLAYAQFKTYFDDLSVYPVAYAGHSLGEYTALTCAGAMNFADALRIVRRRGQLMQAVTEIPSGMAAIIGSTKERVLDACEEASTDSEIVVLANDNSANQVVISGHAAAVDRAIAALQGDGVRISRLSVSAPFHSPYMRKAAEQLRDVLNSYQFNDPQVPVIANVDAKPYSGADQIVDHLTRQLYSRVNWTATMEYLSTLQINSVMEIGPKQVLSNLFRTQKPEIPAFALDKESDRADWVESLKPQPGEVTLLGRAMAVAVCTRNHNFDNDAYQKGVVEPYNQIKSLQDSLEERGQYPSTSDMVQALNWLKQILDTKGTPVAEQRSRFEQILKETGTYPQLRDKTPFDFGIAAAAPLSADSPLGEDSAVSAVEPELMRIAG